MSPDVVYTATVDLPVGPDEAFALVTEPERLRRWTAVSATVDLRAGGEWRWQVTPGHTAGGTVREIEPGRRVMLGWGWVDDDVLPPDASTASVHALPNHRTALPQLAGLPGAWHRAANCGQSPPLLKTGRYHPPLHPFPEVRPPDRSPVACRPGPG